MLFNTGNEPVMSTAGLLTTVGYQLGRSAKPVYALEVFIYLSPRIDFIKGLNCDCWRGSEMAARQFKHHQVIAGNQQVFLNANLLTDRIAGVLAEQVEDTGGVYFVPAFSGLFAPYWRDDARGCA